VCPFPVNGAHDVRDEIVDYIKHWTARAELPAKRLLGWLGLGTSKFHDWKNRYGKVNEHNGTPFAGNMASRLVARSVGETSNP